jgi:hypothetical protein
MFGLLRFLFSYSWCLNFAIEGPQLPKKIRALASFKEYTFAAYGSDIAVFKRTDLVRELLCLRWLNLSYLVMFKPVSALDPDPTISCSSTALRLCFLRFSLEISGGYLD